MAVADVPIEYAGTNPVPLRDLSKKAPRPTVRASADGPSAAAVSPEEAARGRSCCA
jgi:hypothetical protein